MYWIPVFSFDCAVGLPVGSLPCPADTTVKSLQQWFNGHGPPSGLQENQSPGFPAWYQDLDTSLIWPDPDGTGAWVPPFTPT